MARGSRKPRKHYIGRWLKHLGVQQNELAEATDTTEAYISGIASGRKTPSVTVALLISEHLGVSVNKLFTPPTER